MDTSKNSLNHDALAISLPNDAIFKRDQIIGGKYKVISLLGKGGMGSVYRVQDLFQHLEFALKTLDIHSVSEVTVRRFQVETKTASLLDHPNLVRMHDFGLIENGQPYLVMEFVDGITLSQYLREQGSMSVEQAAPLFAQVCCALHHAHEQGVVHRDIKPSNIMLVKNAASGTEGSVKVVDFGIARLANGIDGEIQSLTNTGEVFGSPLYMSPEQCLGEKVDHRSDVYSLGCVLFETLTGAPPHLGQNALTTMMMHRTQPAPTLKEASLGKEFPEALEQIVSRMLCKTPDDRYQNLGIVAHQLANVCRGGAAAEIQLPTRNPEKTPRVVALSPSRLYSLLAITAIGTATLSVLSLKTIEQFDRSAPSGSDAKAITGGRPTLEASKTLSSDIGSQDGFAEVLQSKLPSTDSINEVFHPEVGKNRQIIFPERAIGTLWESYKGVRLYPPLGEARGAISVPAAMPIALELNDAVLLDPAILEKVDLSSINGLVFSNSSKLKSEKYLDGMKNILSPASKWKNLQLLLLIACPADNRVLDSLNKLKNLQYLVLLKNAGLDENALSREPYLHRLKVLCIECNCAEQSIRKIAGSPNLESILLTNSGVSPEAIQELSRCPRLEYLAIVDSREKRIDDRILDNLARMKRLRTVVFYRMDAEQVGRLSHYPWIKEIHLSDPAYSPAQKEHIKSVDARVKFMKFSGRNIPLGNVRHSNTHQAVAR